MQNNLEEIVVKIEAVRLDHAEAHLVQRIQTVLKRFKELSDSLNF